MAKAKQPKKVKYTKKKSLKKDIHKVAKEPDKTPLKRGRRSMSVGSIIKKTVIKNGPQATCEDVANCIGSSGLTRSALESWILDSSYNTSINNRFNNLSWLELADTADVSYLSKNGFVPQVDGSELALTSVNDILLSASEFTDLKARILNAITCADLTSGSCRENIQDVIGDMVTGNVESGVSVTYDDANGKLNFLVDPCIGGTGGGGGGLDCTTVMACAGIVDLSNRITANEGDIAGLDTRLTTAEGDITTLQTDVTNLQSSLTQEQVQDWAAPLLDHANHIGVTATYNDAANEIILEVTGGGG